MEGLWRAIEEGWFDYLFLVLVGRSALAWLPPGRIGGSRLSELPATVMVSALLGHAAMTWTYAVAPRVEHEQRWLLFAPWLALGALRLFTRPHAFVAGSTPPTPVDARGRLPAALAVLVASLSPLWWSTDASRENLAGRAFASIGLLLVATAVVHALAQSRRALAGRVLIAALIATTPALRESVFHVPTLPAAFVALTCAGLIGWTRRADPRHSALALIGSAATYPYSPTAWLAGFATVVAFSHNRARRSALIGAAALFVLVIVLERWLGDAVAVQLSNEPALPILAPGFLDALERRELWGLVWHASALAAAATLAGVSGGRTREMVMKPGEAERPTRELRAVLAYVGLAFVLHALERFMPESLAPAHTRPTWLGFFALMLPAAGIVLGLVFIPGERAPARPPAP